MYLNFFVRSACLPQSYYDHRNRNTCLSLAPVATHPILWTTAIPFDIRPKIVCFPIRANQSLETNLINHIVPSNHGVGASEIKNWLPFVLGPALAIDAIPAPVCFKSLVISSSNFPLLGHEIWFAENNMLTRMLIHRHDLCQMDHRLESWSPSRRFLQQHRLKQSNPL